MKCYSKLQSPRVADFIRYILRLVFLKASKHKDGIHVPHENGEGCNPANVGGLSVRVRVYNHNFFG